MSAESPSNSNYNSSSEGNGKKNSSGKDHSGTGGRRKKSQQCAACKGRFARCPPHCPLAPYFPAENPQRFFNAKKLFGVKKLCKILKETKEPRRGATMASMIFEANARARDPVGGCIGIVQRLEELILSHKKVLEVVNQHLDVFRTLQTNNSGGGVDQENGNGDLNLDDILNFLESFDSQDLDVFDNILDIGSSSSSSSENFAVLVPNVELETGQTPPAPPQP